MTQWKLAGSTAVIALVAGQAAWADITPAEVWQKWKDMSASYGQTVTTTSEEADGGTLTISGANFASTQEGAEASMTIDQITLEDQGDGTVAISFSDSYSLAVKGENSETGEAQDIVIDISSPGMNMVASGTAAETAYTIVAPELKVALASVDGVDAATLGTDVSATMKGIAGSYSTTGTDAQTVDSDVRIDSMDIVAKVADPEAGGTFNLAATMASLSSVSSTTLPAGLDMTDMAAALAAGFASKGGLTYGQTEFTFDFAEGEDTGTGKGTIGGGDFTFVMVEDALEYGNTTKAFDVAVSASSIPFPEVKVAFAESAFGFLMPVAASEEPADFKVLTKVVDLTISDEIWGMVDPMSNLPRDPLTFVLDTSGTATLTTSLMDPEAMEAADGAPPGEVNSLDLTTLQLKALGAEITGNGALTFDNSDMTTFNGMPKPTGTITLNATGINALLDKLQAMGMIPDEQLMGARMMMGMFAKPGEGEDSLVSVLEFKDGGFFANGMQLQ